MLEIYSTHTHTLIDVGLDVKLGNQTVYFRLHKMEEQLLKGNFLKVALPSTLFKGDIFSVRDHAPTAKKSLTKNRYRLIDISPVFLI